MNNNLLNAILKFRDDRNWKQFHTPGNLAKSICIESAELLEKFQWQEKDYEIEEVKDEISDIFIYLILIYKTIQIDIEKSALKKIHQNEKKYPIKLSKNNYKKYNKLAK